MALPFFDQMLLWEILRGHPSIDILQVASGKDCYRMLRFLRNAKILRDSGRFSRDSDGIYDKLY